MFADTIFSMNRTSLLEGSVDPDIADVTPDTVMEGCTGDPFEFLTSVYYESQLNMININQAVMVCEYAYLKDNGSEMVYESNVVTKMFGSIKDHIVNVWRKICAFFKSIFTWLENIRKTDEQFVSKYDSKLREIRKGKKSVDIGKFKGYTYAAKKHIIAMGKDISTVATDQFKLLENRAAAYGLDSRLGTEDGETDIEGLMDKVRGSMVGEASVSSSEFNNKMTEFYRGEETTQHEFSGKELQDMLNVISSTKITKADINVVYTKCKSYIDTLLNAAKKSETDAKKDKGKDSSAAKNYHARATILNSLTGLATVVSNKATKSITAHNRQCRAIISKAVAKYDSDSPKNDTDKSKAKATGESAFVDSVFESFGF